MIGFLFFLLLVVAAIYLLSDMFFRWMGVGSLAWGNRTEPKIALTFDDGPGKNTQAILELLRTHDIRASFFILGSQADQHPELVEAIRADGHQLESHGQIHKPAFFMWPWQEADSIQKVPGKLYRPPHGIHSPFTRILARAAGKQVMLWDVESQDWTKKKPEELAARIIMWCRPGSVVLLHDNDVFPQTLEVLKIILPRLKELGYKMVRLDEMELKPLSLREGVMRANQGGHEGYFIKHKVQKLGDGPFDYLSVAHAPFPGPEQPGLKIGDECLEVHIDSVRTPHMGHMQLLRESQKGFRLLAQQLVNQPEIKGIWGISYAAVGLKVFGFHLAPIKWHQQLISGAASTWFMWVYKGELPKRNIPSAQLAYITREDFIEKWTKPAKAKKEEPKAEA